ncbi:MAG: CheR family methyltransferase [Candidatus Ozemobacteraceae bacterium]
MTDSSRSAIPPVEPASETESDVISLDLLLEAIWRKYGYDYRDYSRASLLRRLRHRQEISGLAHLSELISPVLHDERFFRLLQQDLSIQVSEMFRDPSFYLLLREQVIPFLRTWPSIRIWFAGCAGGEEVFSFAILLQEEGLLDKTTLYATDIIEDAINRAREGIFPIERMNAFSENYRKAGGQGSFSDFFTARYGSAIMRSFLREHIVFSVHNLATDAVFGEMTLICCRNVLIYFNQKLKNRALSLFKEALTPGGFLCLGSREILTENNIEKTFHPFGSRESIYRNIAPQLGCVSGEVSRSGDKCQNGTRFSGDSSKPTSQDLFPPPGNEPPHAV